MATPPVQGPLVLSKLAQNIFELLQASLRRPARQHAALRALAQDLTLVWIGLRAAMLVDSCVLSREEAENLARDLRTHHKDLLVLYEPESGQTLICHRERLAERLAEKVIVVEVGKAVPNLLPAPPASFTDLASQITSHVNASPFLLLALPDRDRPYELVGLVGFLLEYEVTYSLEASSDGTNCLGGVELVLVEAALVSAGARRALLAFSYPATLAAGALSRETVAEAVKSRLERRLADARIASTELDGARVEVSQRLVTLDRVAL